MKFKVNHRPVLKITSEPDGTFTAELKDPAWGKVWSGWADSRDEAIQKGKSEALAICGTSDVVIS